MSFELAPFALPADYTSGIVSLADMKAHLGVLHDDQDDLIEVFRDAAVDMVERYCGVRLGECSDLVWKGERLCSTIRLGVWPVTDISAITWLDSDGQDVTGDASIWRIALRDEIALKPGQSLPVDASAGVAITFDAGFTSANRPAALVQAVKMFAAHLFRHREAVGATVSGEIPLGFRQLCSAYRMPVI